MQSNEKKVVKKKKSKFNKVNVYFNSDSKGNTKYFTGKFYSHKNNRILTYRSSYELKFFLKLEEDDKVDSYVSEGLNIPYKNSYGKRKIYVPDVLVLYTDGSMTVYEIKPSEMLKDADVILKAKACEKYLENICKSKKISYKFLTERKLFKDQYDYLNFLNKYRNVDFSKQGYLAVKS